MCLTFSINILYIVHHCTWNVAVECFSFASFPCLLNNALSPENTTEGHFVYLISSVCTKYNHIIVSQLAMETRVVRLYSFRP